jgi:hypothetical protein
MTEDKHDNLLERDWGDEWDRLPAVELPRPGTAASTQITLRVPARMLAALKAEAQRKRLTYHSLARSWIAERLAAGTVPGSESQLADFEWPADAQLNIKLDAELMHGLKEFSHRTRIPYHRLARLWIQGGLDAQLRAPAAAALSMRDAVILMLHARGPGGAADEAIRGLTRLDKLIFVATQERPDLFATSFYAHHYGPLDDDVYEAVQSLESAGLVEGDRGEDPRTTSALPTYQEMLDFIRAKGPQQRRAKVFQLSRQGSQAAERLAEQGPEWRAAYDLVESVKQRWGRLSDDELVERVYERWPAFASASRIATQVRDRAARRSRRAPR